jgi:pyruvate dehydrogenase E2 component (dihydrolipoamide acetyltransferase)
MTEVTMPQLGESVTEGTITKWFKGVGDAVAMDEVLFEVSTDKVDSEVPSPVAGFLTEIRAPEGETVEVGDVIAVVSAEAPAAAPAEPPAGAAPADAAPPSPPPPAPAAPSAPAPPAAPTPAAAPAAGVVVSPLVRRLATEAGIDVGRVAGTGVGGRITRADVEAAIAGRGAGGAAGRAGAPRVAARVTAGAGSLRADRPRPQPRTGTGDTVEPFNNIRRRTAEHMLASVATSAHAVTVVEVDYESVERVRALRGAEWAEREGFGLTYLPFISRAVVLALADFPHINASVGDGELLVHNYVNLGIAVDVNFEGMLVPVIHDADGLTVAQLARAEHDLASGARELQLSADDISGGTFTISNSGSFGTHLMIPIINQPQVAVLSTDGISRRPVVVTGPDGSEAIAIHSVGLLAMAWDHRAFDGAYAAAFLAEVREIIETRDWDAEL